MMKKCLALLMILMLLCLSVPALAADASMSALYQLVSRDAYGHDTMIGSAVLFMERTTLLTTVWAAQATGGLYAIGSGGEFAITRGVKLTSDSELLILTLAQESPATPLLLGSSKTDGLISIGLRADGAAVAYAARSISTVERNGATCLMMSAEEGLLPGSVLMDQQMNLAGVVTASYGEGVGRYVVMPAELIYQELKGDTQEIPYELPEAALPEGESWLEGVTAAYADGLIEVDWSACPVDSLTSDSVFEVFFADVENPYYFYVEAGSEETSVLLPAVPGRCYAVWVLHAPGEPEADVYLPPQLAIQVETDEALPFDLYDYADQAFYVASAPADQQPAAEEWIPPLSPVTAQGLMDPDAAIYMQVASQYVVEQTEEALLMAVLYTPEGYAFCAEGGFIFDPSLMESDVWHMDITMLLDDYCAFNSTGEPAAGVYTLSYYLDGALANQLTFTLP